MTIPFSRAFSMGALDALRTYRRQATATPEVSRDEIVALAKTVAADATGLDFSAAMEIHSLISDTVPHDPAHEFYRACIFALILSQRIGWGRVITLGRMKFYGTLERDEQACFRAARLLENPPAADVVEWWDRLECAVRAADDADKKKRSRVAERLTYDYEVKELARLGISLRPEWVAVDDNTVGYDLKSFRLGEFGPVNLLIEVKSSIASPLRFIVTRGEWDRATKWGDAYVFYIWDLTATPPRPYFRTKAQIERHIPVDKRKGKWKNVEIPLAAV